MATGGNRATGGAAVGGAATGGNHATGGAGVGGAASGGNKPTGGAPAASGGNKPTGGAPAASGGNKPTGGAPSAAGGFKAVGGSPPGSGGAATGGANATGGAATGGANATGGAATGGSRATGGAATGGANATGGAATGGSRATGGASTSTSTSTSVDCSAPMPTGGTQHTGNTRGGSGSLAWEIWRNGSGGSITTFSTPAFSASWSNSGDFLARIGLEWGNSGKAYTAYGTIKAEFTYTKTGTGGGYSYIGVYGWSTNPCVEYYIIDDSFNGMPFTPWNSSNKGSASIDGETYKFYSNSTNGTGGSRCGGASSWAQHWSIRQKGRQCGTITISDHFKAWDAAGMKLGTMLEAKILVETGGGSGSVNFPLAKVTAE